MKNYKKFLAAFLALAISLSMSAISTLSYFDVESGTSVSSAIEVLSNLKIIEGFEDGSFRPEESVTRAQMAAIICRTLNYEEQALSSGGSTPFYDVDANHWAAGYINVSYTLGIINGYGDGRFGPEDKVTYEQAVKMVVCALGYDLVAQNKGGYPSGYLSVASSEGITKNSNGSIGMPAKRSTVAMLVHNSLEVRLFDQSTWTTNGSDEFKKTDDTILSKYRNVNKWEGVVTSVPLVDYADDGYDEDDTPYVTIKGFYERYNSGILQKVTENATVTADCSLVDASALLGKKVVAYVGADEDDETGNVMIYAISEKPNSNSAVKISSLQLIDSEDKDFKTSGEIGYRKPGSTKVYDAELKENVVFYVNYSREGSLDENSSTEDISKYVEFGGSIELISNDNNDDIEYVIINAYTDEGVIEEIQYDDGLYMFDTYFGEVEDIDEEKENELVVVFRDGVLTEVDKLKEGDTVSTVSINKDVRILYASSESVTGTIRSWDSYNNEVTIGNVDYKISPFLSKSASSMRDEEGTFFINVDGLIAYNETSSTAKGNYALVLAVAYYGGISQGYDVQAVTGEGNVVQYELSSKVRMYDESGSEICAGDTAVANKLAQMADGTTDAKNSIARTTVANAGDMVLKITVKNSEITKIRIPEGGIYKSYLSSNTKRYDEESMSYGSVEFDEDTVVFSVDKAYSSSSTTRITDDDVSVGTVRNFFTDEEDGYRFAALDEDNGIYGAVIGFEIRSSVPEHSDAVIISSVKRESYDNDTAYRISGIAGGKDVNFLLYNEDFDYAWGDDPELLSTGDVILTSSRSESSVVEDYKLIYKANRNGLGTVTTNALAGSVGDEIYNAVGKLDKSKTTSSKFFINSDVTNSGSSIFAEAEDGITMKSSANYTLVDYSESRKNPEISKKNPGTSLFSTGRRYDAFVFVRVYDGVLKEVVVYRFDAEDSVVQSVKTPEISVRDFKATITCATSGANIYYTLDGTEPGANSPRYTAEIPLSADTVIKAFAAKAGYDDSGVKTYNYTVPAVALPVISISEEGEMTISAEDGAAVYYTTDGSEPTASSTLYTASVVLEESCTVKAIAVKANYKDSAVKEVSYEKTVAPLLLQSAPAISIMDNGTATLSADEGATIYYTTDGKNPTEGSSVYSSSLALMEKTTIKAMAVKEGYENSNVSEKTYTPELAAPVISITKSGAVTITATEGAKVYYSIDGKAPSTIYTASFNLSAKATVKAFAEKEGYKNSDVSEKAYTPELAAPVISITKSGAVTITAAEGARVYYSIDGKAPSTIYTASFNLSTKATVKAFAEKEGYENSSLAEKVYLPLIPLPKAEIVKNPALADKLQKDGLILKEKVSLKKTEKLLKESSVVQKESTVKTSLNEEKIAETPSEEKN